MNPVILYLAIGALVGPLGFGLITPDLAQHGRHIEAVSQVVLLFALFGAGLRLRLKLDWQCWRMPVRFATLSMLGTLLLVTIAAHLCLGLELPAALLLAAILAPTDPSLAADVRLPLPDDSGVRTLLTTESALGAVLGVPAVLLALGVLGNYDLGRDGFHWVVTDVVWATAGGVVIGWLTGTLAWRKFGRPQGGREAELPEELIAVGTIAFACGVAMLLRASPLASVFAAGLALSHGGRLAAEARSLRPSARFEGFAARLERFGLVAALLLLGAMLTARNLRADAVVFAVILLTLLRPLAARLGLMGASMPAAQQRLAAWFGMRGIVSVYLLGLAVNHGLDAAMARNLTGIVVVVLVTCVALQELTATPLIGRRVDQRA